MTRTLSLLFLVALLTGCGPFTNLKLTDDPSALTTGGSDALFTLSLDPGGFNIAFIGVAANLPGQPQTTLACPELPPFDEEVTFACREPGTNLFDETSVGRVVRVLLFARKPEDRSKVEFEFTTMAWVPVN